MRERRQPSWFGSGRTLVFRHGTGTGETIAVNRVGRGESDNQGWFSYDDGTELANGQLSHAGDRLAAVAGGNEIHLFGVSQPPPALPAAALRRAGRPVRRSDVVARRLDARVAGGRRRARRRPGARPARRRARLLGDPRAAAGGGQRSLLGRRGRAGRELGHAGAGRAGGAAAGAGVPLAAGREAPARARRAPAAAGHPRARPGRGAAAPWQPARRARAAAPGARGDAAPAGAAQRRRAASARPPGAADAAPHRDGARARPLAGHARAGAWR